MSKRTFIFIVAVIFLSLSFGSALSVAHAAEDKFGGLGLKVAQIYEQETGNHMGSLVVLDVLDGTPASKSGIQRGDVITHINGEPTKGKTFKYLIMEKLRGKIGSKADISIERAEVKAPLNFSLTRIEITYTPEQKQ
ncbi:PDZ domain-containing protein [Desulfogranum japonicum]|uniref:PDZ domain-containing protein n=1 Tax=Desulfogranum japonicum TaxID=231447 RepID=UPI00040399B8|nr:PDZ domain-containing protein [Desulfogranum japonicum]